MMRRSTLPPAANEPDSWGSIARDAFSSTFSRFLPPLLLLAVIWVVFIAQLITGPALFYALGIPSGEFTRIWTWFTSPFIHANLPHIVGNSFFLLLLGVLVAVEGRRRWAVVTVLAAICSGLVTTVLSTNTVTGGASGLVFGYFGYLLTAPWFEVRRGRKILRFSVAVMLLVSYSFTLFAGFIPNGNMSWQAHLGGFLGGIVAAMLTLRSRGSAHNEVGGRL